jgi:predicted RNA-binding protein with PUA-like domain
MQYFLAKTDPETYSITDFERDHETIWDGVHNYTAIAVIKSWQIGDLVYIYHSQNEKAIVGLAEVVSKPTPDVHDVRGISWVAKLRHRETYPPHQRVTLQMVKESGLFADFPLVKIGRLSTMACTDLFIQWVQKQMKLLATKS